MYLVYRDFTVQTIDLWMLYKLVKSEILKILWYLLLALLSKIIDYFSVYLDMMLDYVLRFVMFPYFQRIEEVTSSVHPRNIIFKSLCVDVNVKFKHYVCHVLVRIILFLFQDIYWFDKIRVFIIWSKWRLKVCEISFYNFNEDMRLWIKVVHFLNLVKMELVHCKILSQ